MQLLEPSAGARRPAGHRLAALAPAPFGPGPYANDPAGAGAQAVLAGTAELNPGAHMVQFHEPETPAKDPAGQAALAIAPDADTEEPRAAATHDVVPAAD